MNTFISIVKRHALLAMVALLLCLTPSTVGATSPANAGPDFTAIDAYVQAQMNESRIPGLALAIVHGDQIVYLKGYGSADPSGRPVTPQTPFMLASLAKPMTTLAVMQLVEAGKLISTRPCSVISRGSASRMKTPPPKSRCVSCCITRAGSLN